jgi:glucose-1-phosphate thymidylyltransferase
MKLDKAVILAAGRGTRMQREENAAALSPEQAKIASAGLKAMIPVGRPFIDYVLSSLADAGYRRACLVVGSDQDILRKHCDEFVSRRLEIHFAVQQKPTGTASAVAAASGFVGEDPFLLINSDNFYPAAALVGLRQSSGSAVVGFPPEALLRGNIRSDRLRNFAMLLAATDGKLEQVVEKPEKEYSLQTGGEVLISMNCWRFTPIIFKACQDIPPSKRGEYELTDAVNYAIQQFGERFGIVIVNEPVLDLTTRADIAAVSRRLTGIQIRL